MKKFLCLLLCFFAALPVSGCDFFAAPGPDPEPEPQTVAEPPPEPEYFQNPLTGLYDLEAPYSGRPFAVSVNNIEAGLPQSGVSAADIVVEIETEGGITRLMCVFSAPEKAAGGIGSIRSLRHQFIAAIYQWDPVIVHIGTSDYAEEYMWARGIRTMNGYYSDSFIYIDKQRSQSYASEHTKFTDATHLQEGMEDGAFSLSSEWNPAGGAAFNFAPKGETAGLTGGAARNINYDFSKYYDGDFRYDEASGKYLKYQHGSPHIDAGNGGAQLAFDNVLLLFAPVYGLYGELIDVDYSVGGEGYYFCGGSFERFTWTKDAYDQEFVFKKADGSDLVINAGKTHLGIIRTSFAGSLLIDQPPAPPLS
jgi:hypothetical protein